MDAVHATTEDEDFRVGMNDTADVVGVFDARVGY